MEKIVISTAGINKILKKYTEEKAICEYIWNGFDAEATNVKVDIFENNINGIERIEISDDGIGINYDLLKEKFRPFYQSEKYKEINIKTSRIHGKNGIGRLTFSCFASNAKWKTTYEDKKKKFSYEIDINRNSLDEYRESDKLESNEETGTTITFSNINKYLDINELKKYLISEYCWYFILYPNKNLWINGEKIDFKGNILNQDKFEMKDEENNLTYQIKYFQWKRKINDEYSRYYFLNSKGEEIFKETTTLNNKGDTFYHSIFIQGEIFDNFYIKEEDYDNQIEIEELSSKYSKASKEYKNLKKQIDKYLREKRKPYLSIVAENLINNYKEEDIFPKYNEKNFMEVIKHNELENLVSIVCEKEPRIFNQLNKEQKKTIVRLFDLIIDNGDTGSLYKILDEVIDLTADERDELANVLEKTTLNNVTKTIKLIEDRLKAVEELKKLIYDEGLNANEVDHIQKMMENYLWIFGEEYFLVTAEEPDFKEALKRYLYILQEDNGDIEIDSEDKRKQMDIFARRSVDGKTFENIVVELKHPKVSLGKKQLDQVDNYMRTILKEPRFNNHNEKWTFYLVGSKFDTSGYIEAQIENNKIKGENSLVFSVNNYKIYVKKWSEIFTELELRFNYLQEKLQVQKENLLKDMNIEVADDIIKDIDDNSSTSIYDPKVIEFINNKN